MPGRYGRAFSYSGFTVGVDRTSGPKGPGNSVLFNAGLKTCSTILVYTIHKAALAVFSTQYLVLKENQGMLRRRNTGRGIGRLERLQSLTMQ